jgi:hypothetical protein
VCKPKPLNTNTPLVFCILVLLENRAAMAVLVLVVYIESKIQTKMEMYWVSMILDLNMGAFTLSWDCFLLF